MKHRVGTAFLLVGAGSFMFLTFILPLIFVAERSVGTGSSAIAMLTSSYYQNILVFTLKQSLLSTLFSILFGLPGAWLLGRCRFPGRRMMKSLFTLPFVLPPILAVLGFVLVFGNTGVINGIRKFFLGADAPPWKMLYGLPAIVLAHIFYNFSLTARIVGDAWGRLPLLEQKAAKSLGANHWQAFFFVDFPRLLPAIATAGMITFLYCFQSFAVILVLGGGLEVSTLEVEIYRLAKQQLDFVRGSVLAVVESLIAFTLLFLYAKLDAHQREKTGDDTQSLIIREPKRVSGLRGLLALAYLLMSSILILVPLMAVVVYGFLDQATRSGTLVFSISHWQNLLGMSGAGRGASLNALLRSFLLATAVAIITTCVSAATAWYVARKNRWHSMLETMMALPLGVSSIILGLGWLLLLQKLPHGVFARMLALVLAHSVLSLPFCFRILFGRLQEISSQMIHAARVAGASRFKAFALIEVPMAKQALLTSGVFSFALSAGELNATAILAPGNFTTAPLAIYRLIGAYNFGGACALGSMLMIICILAFWLFDHYAEI